MTAAARPPKKPPAVHRTGSERATLALARKLGRSLRGDEVVLLVGELGAGKTVFAKGIASGLGVKDVRSVCSPSFTLLNVYQGRVPVYHLDLYRLDRAAEIRELGFEDYIGEGVVLVEWGEKAGLPAGAVVVRIEVGEGDRREITIEWPARRRGAAAPGRD